MSGDTLESAIGPTDASNEHLYVTVKDEDENQILELVKVDVLGMYVRDNHNWMGIDPDADNDRVWDRVIFDVTPEAVEVFDQTVDKNGEATVDQLQSFIIEGDE